MKLLTEAFIVLVCCACIGAFLAMAWFATVWLTFATARWMGWA